MGEKGRKADRVRVKNFKYSYPNNLIYIISCITFLSLYASVESVSQNKEETDILIHCLTFIFLMVLILLIIRWKRPGFILLGPNSIECRIFRFFIFKNYSLTFDQIQDAHVVQLQNSPGIRLITENGFIDIDISNIPLKDLSLFTSTLQEALLQHGHKIRNISEVERIIKLWSNGSAQFATILIFLAVIGCAVSSLTDKYLDRQMMDEKACIPIVAICYLMSYLFFKKWRSFEKGVGASIFASIPVFIFSSYFCGGVFSYLNQKYDDISPEVMVVSVKETDSPEHRKGSSCYLINDDYIKEEVSWEICDDINPKISETSIVELSYKKGTLGQRWIASAKLLDKEGSTDINFD